MTPQVGRVDHTEHYHNRTIIAIELPADINTFWCGDLVTIHHTPHVEPETPPATDEGDWLEPATSHPIRNLVKAGALIAAEIDRLQRAAP